MTASSNLRAHLAAAKSDAGEWPSDETLELSDAIFTCVVSLDRIRSSSDAVQPPSELIPLLP